MCRRLSNSVFFLSLSFVVISYVPPLVNSSPFLYHTVSVGSRPVVGQLRVSGDSELRPSRSNCKLKDPACITNPCSTYNTVHDPFTG